MRTPPPTYIANFDSASAMVRATARYLKGKDFPALGQGAFLKPFVRRANRLGRMPREALFSFGGWGESVSGRSLGKVKSEALTHWAAGLYPKRSYPAAVIGSSSGALVHLCTALGIPWLPQTFLIPVSQTEVHPDEPKNGMEAALPAAEALLKNNPDLQLHHMHDPNQDRLMLSLMTYFRVKLLRLGEAYRQFLEEHLEPGATLFVADCRRTWPSTRLSERHIFQFGALGGATPDEFLHGSERVEAYLERYHSHRRRWDPPEPNEDTPEAEWGFEPRLMEEIEQLARERNYRLVRIVFDEPEHLSPLVADLYRWWYRERHLHPNRLLVESFILMEPHWAVRTGSAPFWMKFNMEPSAQWLSAYLEGTEPYDEIHLMLFPHGVECVGVPSIDEWKKPLHHARKRGRLAGVDEQAYPRDFSILSNYQDAVKEIPSRYGMPGWLAMEQFNAFLAKTGDRYPVKWEGLLH